MTYRPSLSRNLLAPRTLSEEFKADIRSLNLSARAYNALVRSLTGHYIKAESMAELEKLSINDLQRGRNLGRVTARQVVKAIQEKAKCD